jgi:hypothetical protein
MVFRRKQVGKPRNVESDDSTRKEASESQRAEPLSESHPSVNDEDLASDLMSRVGAAIDDWSVAHGLEGMPRKVVFQQALSYLNALADTVDSKPR